MLHSIKKDLLVKVFTLKREQNDEAGKGMELDIEEVLKKNAHWERVQVIQAELDELINEIGETDKLSALYIRNVTSLIPFISVSKFLKILEICGVEADESIF